MKWMDGWMGWIAELTLNWDRVAWISHDPCGSIHINRTEIPFSNKSRGVFSPGENSRLPVHLEPLGPVQQSDFPSGPEREAREDLCR